MSSDNLPASSDQYVKPWGEANPRRGANHEIAALAFLRAFPVGTTLTAEAFDEWAQTKGLIKVPVSVKKKSDAWLAHLQRRHQLRYSINLAGSHPRMENPFVIEAVGQNIWEVRSPETAIARNQTTKRIESLTQTRRKQLAFLMQSADWSALPPYERIFAESLYDDINAFGETIEQSARQLNNKFQRLEHNLRVAVERGEIQPRNGGIKAIVGGTREDE